MDSHRFFKSENALSLLGGLTAVKNSTNEGATEVNYSTFSEKY